jgi:hypothetical protein
MPKAMMRRRTYTRGLIFTNHTLPNAFNGINIARCPYDMSINIDMF